VITIEKMADHDLAKFRELVLIYWQELIPNSEIWRDVKLQNAHFQQEFDWDDLNCRPHWLKSADQIVGFINFAVFPPRAEIDDFFIIPEARRHGYGTQAVRALFKHFDELGIGQIDLNVRRDNSVGLAFWQAQGFGIAGFLMRQYRDPATGTAFSGEVSSASE
jgi:ribosomal protein S18 acetylase RimI-like enzyme